MSTTHSILHIFYHIRFDTTNKEGRWQRGFLLLKRAFSCVCVCRAVCRRMRLESFMKDAMPFAAMVIVECGEVGMSTLGKSVMTSGMSNFVYVVYYNALGTFILLPYFIFHIHRCEQPPITFALLWRFFLLGLIGICLVPILAFTGIKYSSPTLAAAIGNLIPVFTFLLAIIFRMEKLDLRRSSSQAKSLGTIISISGAFMVTLYKGPPILMVSTPSTSPHLLLSQKSNWVLGGLFIAVTSLMAATWNIVQAATVKEYPEKTIIVFFYCFFGTIQCAIFSLVAERDPSAWRLHPGTGMIAIVYSAIFASVFRSSVITWCLQKKGPVFVALFKPLSIAIAVVMGIIFLGETLHLGSVIGATVIALGFYAVMWGQAKETDMGGDNVCSLESSTQKTPLLPKKVIDGRN